MSVVIVVEVVSVSLADAKQQDQVCTELYSFLAVSVDLGDLRQSRVTEYTGAARLSQSIFSTEGPIYAT